MILRKDDMTMAEERFEFGKNWEKFRNVLTEERIKEAERSLKEWLGTTDMQGKSFFDIGSGSGLFSLAARNMGARVFSFDYDEDSVNCTKYLKDQFYKNDTEWQVERGDILDEEYLSKFGKYDIVYSWGVLHHTGNMYKALKNAGNLVVGQGTLFIAIYNDQGWKSKMWRGIKKAYCNAPRGLRSFIPIFYFIGIESLITIRDILKGKPFHTWRTYVKRRGMSPYHDVVDWVGGYPFEVAKPEEIFAFFHEKGFTLEKMSTVGGKLGCNQYVFKLL